MRKAFLVALVLGLGLVAWAQVWDTMAVTVTINPAYPDWIDVPESLLIAVDRLAEAVSAEQTLTYTTDYTGRDITVEVQGVAGTIPSGFKLFISTNKIDWLEIDLDPADGYAAVTLFKDVEPGEKEQLYFWIKADATRVGVGGAGTFTITLKFTLTSLP